MNHNWTLERQRSMIISETVRSLNSVGHNTTNNDNGRSIVGRVHANSGALARSAKAMMIHGVRPLSVVAYISNETISDGPRSRYTKG
ncbi:hypothetical protein TNCV_5013411 [Trichonephila clavipes]|nr:hypothetical protein TNCV_5013411 [Trichonephila clavipes]